MNPFNDSEHDDLEELARQFKESVEGGNYASFDSEDYQDIIAQLIENGELGYAMMATMQAIQKYPEELYFRLMRAKIFAMEFEFSDALNELQYIEQNFELTPEYYVEKVLIYHASNQELDSISLLNKALELDENTVEAHLLLTHEYLAKRNIDNAVSHAVRAIQLDSFAAEDLKIVTIDFQDFFDSEDYTLVQFFQRMTEELPMCASIWAGLGIAYVSRSNYEQAIEAFQFQLSLDEEDPLCYLNLAEAYYELGDYAEALRNYDLGSVNSDWLVISFQKGNCYFEMEEYDEALRCYLHALDDDPTFPEAISKVVATFNKQGRYDEARAFLRMKNAEYPDNAGIMLRYIEILNPAYDDELLRSLSAHLLQISNETLPVVIHFLASYFINNDALDLGIEILTDYQATGEPCNELHYYLAALYINKGQVVLGCEHLEMALQLDPESFYHNFACLVPDFSSIPEVKRLKQMYTK